MTNWPLCDSVNGMFRRPIGRYPDTLIDYQAKRKRKRTLLAPDLRAFEAGGHFASSRQLP